MKAATWTLVEEDGSLTLHAEGDWTALTLDQASRQPLPAVGGQQANRIDVSALGRIDTTGALLLLKLMPTDGEILFALPLESRWQAAAGRIGVDMSHMPGYAGHA